MSKGPIEIVLPPVWSAVYLNTARLLKYSLEEMGDEVFIVEAGEQQSGRLSIVLGWNLIPDDVHLKQPYIIYQLEPMDLPLWQEKLRQKITLFHHAEMIWDYSILNAQHFKVIGLNTRVLPLGYHPGLNVVSHSEFPDYDVLFVGFLTERRKKVIDELQKYCCVSVQPRWGNDFTEAIGRSKIMLNIHQYDMPTPLEQPRISYALNNQAFVLSETSADNPYKCLVSCSYEKLVATTIYFLKNRKERIKKSNLLFRSFSEFKMTSSLNGLMAELLNKQTFK